MGTTIVNMKKLNINVGDENIAETEVGHGDCAAFRWARANNIDPANLFVVISHGFDKGKDEEADSEAQTLLDSILEKGTTVEGEHYALWHAGSSQLRVAQHTLIADRYRKAYAEWAACGIDIMTNMLPNKALVYRALYTSTSVEWQEGTKVPEPSIDRVAVFPDVEIKLNAKVDYVADSRIQRLVRQIAQKISDGLVILLVPDDTKDEDMTSFTIRAPWMKGCAILIRRGVFRRALQALRLPFEVFDFEGKARDLRELDMIAFKSVYKACKCKPLPQFEAKGMSNWETYVSEFKRLGHGFSICVKDHDALRDVPYQQFQSMLVDDDELDWLASRSVDKMGAYKDPHHASHLLPVQLGKVARIYPDVMADAFVRDELTKAYTTKRWHLMGGRVPAMVKYRFAAPDLVAIMQGLCGAEITGLIPARNVVCNATNARGARVYEAGSIVDCTRSPHLDNAHVLRKVYEPQAFAGLYTGNTVYFSCWDTSMTAMQMDFDGDHVGVIADEDWVRMALRSVKRNGNVCLYYEAKASKPLAHVTKEDCVRLLSALEPAPVGLYAFALNKVYAMGEYDTDKVNYLTKAGNTCIDAAKYISGNGDSMIGGAVKSVLKALKDSANPMFIAYAKSSPFVEGSLAQRMEHCAFYETSAVDRYSNRIRTEVPETLEMDGEKEFQFRWKVLCARIDGQMTIPGLMERFKDLTIDNMVEARGMKQACDGSLYDQFMSEQARALRVAVFVWGEANGVSPERVVNGLVAGIYRHSVSSGMAMQLKRNLWMSFGDMLLANVQANLEAAGTDLSVFDDDPLEEEGYADFSEAGEEVEFEDCGFYCQDYFN